MLRKLRSLSVVCVGWSATLAGAQELPKPTETPGVIPIPSIAPTEIKPTKAVVEVSFTQTSSKGLDFLVSTSAESKKALAKYRDYVGHMVRQERVQGTLLAEETCEIRYRADPMSVSVKTVEPKAQRGAEMIYVSGSKDNQVLYKTAGISSKWLRLPMGDPKLLTNTRHTLEDTGLSATLNRLDRIIAAENKARNPVQVLVSEYKFAQRDCWRFEIACDRPHPMRYAQRVVMFVDKETKMPVRWEAYDAPKPGETKGELLESISFLNLKFNVGLGDSSFEN